MANASNYLETGLLGHLFRDTVFAKPSVLGITLTSGVPTDGATVATLGELSAVGGYGRVGILPSSTNFTAPAATGWVENVNAITFPTASSAWGWVSGVAILDASGYGSGNILFWGELTSPQYVNTNGVFSFASGELNINLD